MTLLYSAELQKDFIDKLNKNEHYTNPAYFEKFIMDFEMLHHIRQKVDCIVRGGMSMPFHLDRTLKRLSTDIDLVIKKPVDKVMKIISEIDLSNEGIRISGPKSIRASNNLPLMIYDISYKSHYDKQSLGHISLDIFYEDIPELESNTIPMNSEILGFTTREDIDVFDVGSLIADKLDTIAKETIGYGDNIDKSTPKQVYDLGRLFEIFADNIPNKPLEKFEAFSVYKSKFYTSDFTFEQVVNSVLSHMDSLVDKNNINSLVSSAQQPHSNFVGQHLGPNGYSRTSYIEDIFKIRLFCKYILQYIHQKISKIGCISNFQNDLKQAIDTDSLSVPEQKIKRTDLTTNFPSSDINSNNLDQVPLRNLSLIRGIAEL